MACGGMAILGIRLSKAPKVNGEHWERRMADRVRREAARQKLKHDAELARLAGGIAHEFNNLFTGILGTASRLQSTVDDPTARSEIHAIENAISRATEISNQIVAYAGRGNIVRQPVALNEFLNEIMNEIRPKLPNAPDLTITPAEPIRFSADVVQLRRLIVNLLMNAAESHVRPGNPITIRMGREPISEDAPTEMRIWLEIADSGSGIAASIRERVFEPFFTTKAPGRGLGLSAVRGIALAHGGTVAMSSNPHGTVVRVELLDRTSQDLIATPSPARRGTVQSPFRTNADVVLVVDDDDSVRELAASTLRAAGWTVQTAENGQQALEMVDQLGANLKLIVLDLVMPVMDGKKVLNLLRHRQSHIPIVIMSGYSDFDLSREFADGTAMTYLQKPFRPPELLEAVADLLEQELLNPDG